MEKKDIPQDPSILDKFTKEICYAVDDTGKYVTDLSRGWDVKAKALGVTWTDIESRIEQAKQKVLRGEASPILYYMELRLMDIAIVSAYTGFWKWRIKRHLKPDQFKRLSLKNMQKYASAFDISIEKFKSINLL
jgi:hypothetical protein